MRAVVLSENIDATPQVLERIQIDYPPSVSLGSLLFQLKVLEMFKRTVLGERGRLRQMSNERLSQIADAAAESFAEQVRRP